MLYVESDSIGPILELVEGQINASHPAMIEVGRKDSLFTIRLTAKDADVRSDGKQP